jgi:hypothetical protein
MKKIIFIVFISLILFSSSISTSKILSLRNNNIKPDRELNDQIIIKENPQNNYFPVNIGEPDFYINQMTCWNSSLTNYTIITGSIMNIGEDYITDGCLVGFLTYNNTLLNYTKAPFLDIDSPGVWKKGEFGLFLGIVDTPVSRIKVWVDFIENIPEKDETNNYRASTVGPDIVVSGNVYNETGNPIKDAQVIHWSTDLGVDKCGVYNTTDQYGYYILSVPVRGPLGEPKTYEIEAKASHIGYRDLVRNTPEACAGDSVVLDFDLEKKSKFISLIPDRLNKFLNNFPLIKRFFE